MLRPEKPALSGLDLIGILRKDSGANKLLTRWLLWFENVLPMG